MASSEGHPADRGGPVAAAAGALSEQVPLSIHEHKGGTTWETETYIKIASSEEQYEKRVARYGRARKSAVDMAGWLREQVGPEPSVPDVRVGGGAADLLRMCRLERDLAHADPRRKVLESLEQCGDWLEFRHYPTHSERPYKLHSARFCQQWRLCNFCALRRAARTLRTYVPRLAEVVTQESLYVYFATFTAKNGEDLAERHEHVSRGLKALMDAGRQSRRSKGKYHPFGAIAGAVFSEEHKRGEGTRGGLWHPHVHGLLLTREPMEGCEADALRLAWCEQLGDADPRGQHVEPLRCMAGLGPEAFTEEQLLNGLGGDLVEVFKYPLKFTGMDPADRWEAASSMRGRRLIRSFGCIRGIKEDEEGDPCEDSADEYKGLPYLDLLLKYSREAGLYQEAQRIFVDGNGGKR